MRNKQGRSISLSRVLWARIEAYAQQREIDRSKAIERGLKAFFKAVDARKEARDAESPR